jgi:tetratricopeptide (TPR) repeat protein
MKQVGSVALILCLASLSSVAQAQSGDAAPPPADDAFGRQVQTAIDLFQKQHYDEAIKAFRAAYAMKPEPEILYNIARVYERSGQIEEALQSYRDFLAAPGTTAALRAKAQENVNALNHEKALREQSNAPQPPTGPASAPRGAGEGRVETSVQEPRPPTGAYVLMGAGVVGIGAGIILGVVAQGNKNDFDKATTVTDKQSAKDSGQRNAAIADVCYGVGIGAAIAGTVWYLLSGDKSGSPAASSPAPVAPVANGQVFGISGVF